MSETARKPDQQEAADRFELELRAKWLEARKRGIGSSDAAAVLDKSPWSSPLKLYAEKRGMLTEKDLAEEFEHVYWGAQLEAPILRRWSRETGRRLLGKTAFQIAWHPDVPHAFASLDGLSDGAPLRPDSAAPPDVGPGVVEAKSINGFKWQAWEERGEAPLEYLIQIQHAMWVTGCLWGSFAVLVDGRRFYWQDVKRDDDFINEVLAPAVADFWRCVEAGEQPAATGSEIDKRVLFLLHPQDSGETIQLDSSFGDDHRIIREGVEALKALEGQVETAKNRIREAMGDATFAEIACEEGVIEYSNKTVNKQAYTVEASSSRRLNCTKDPFKPKKGAR